MIITEHLDKIHKMGFWVTINWNEDFNITYNANDILPATAYAVGIMNCSYFRSQTDPYTFEEMIEVCCDFFYTWYNKNISIIKQFDKIYDQDSLLKLENVCLGDITKSVARELNLSDILNILDK